MNRTNHNHTITTLIQIKLSELIKGDYFRFTETGKTFIYSGKVRMYDKWGKYKGFGFSYYPDDDVNDFKERFSNTLVFIGFDY